MAAYRLGGQLDRLNRCVRGQALPLVWGSPPSRLLIHRSFALAVRPDCVVVSLELTKPG